MYYLINPTGTKPALMRIICISDTHNNHRDLEIPKGEILIHAGDSSLWGNIKHLYDFNDWLGSLPHRYKIVISGNHDLPLQRSNDLSSLFKAREILSNAIYLQDEETILYGVKFYGSPWQPFHREALGQLLRRGAGIPLVSLTQ